MNIAVFGTGIVGKVVGAKLASLGHKVVLGTRDPEATRARTAPGAYGDPSMSAWLEANPSAGVATFKDAAAGADLIFNATSGGAALDALTAAGADALADKIVVDISNPLDFSKGFPPSLSMCNTDSLAEQLQRAFPKVRLVKSLNTVNCGLMVDPGALAAEHTMFVSGNDAEAKGQVTQILREWFGWKDVIDLGDITTARGTEMLLPIWVRLFGVLQTPNFGFKVVR